MEPLSRNDAQAMMDKQQECIEKYFDAKLVPLIADVRDLKRTIYGKDRDDGIVGDVRALQFMETGVKDTAKDVKELKKLPASVKHLRWLVAGAGIWLAGYGIIVFKFFIAK